MGTPKLRLLGLEADLFRVRADSPPDEAVSDDHTLKRLWTFADVAPFFSLRQLDRAGRFGCMAIDSLYNIVYLSDPVA